MLLPVFFASLRIRWVVAVVKRTSNLVRCEKFSSPSFPSGPPCYGCFQKKSSLVRCEKFSSSSFPSGPPCYGCFQKKSSLVRCVKFSSSSFTSGPPCYGCFQENVYPRQMREILQFLFSFRTTVLWLFSKQHLASSSARNFAVAAVSGVGLGIEKKRKIGLLAAIWGSGEKYMLVVLVCASLQLSVNEGNHFCSNCCVDSVGLKWGFKQNLKQLGRTSFFRPKRDR